MAAISRDLFYQLLLTRWEALPVMQLAQPLHVGTLMELALKHEEAAGKWQVGHRGELHHVDTVADRQSCIAYQDKADSQRPLLFTLGNPHRQLRLPLDSTNILDK
jgi:hypothetical protein